MSDVPTLKDELDRKAFEGMEYLLRKVEDKAITQGEFNVAIHTLWSVTAGLIDVDINNAIAELNNGTEKPTRIQRVFLSAEKTVMATVEFSTDGTVRLLNGANERGWSFKSELVPSRAAWDKFIAIIESLLKAGFRPV